MGWPRDDVDTGYGSYLTCMVNESLNDGSERLHAPQGDATPMQTVEAAADAGKRGRAVGAGMNAVARPRFRSAVRVFLLWILLAFMVGGLVGTGLGLGLWMAVTGSPGFQFDPATMTIVSIDPGMLVVATLTSLLATSVVGYVLHGVESKRWWPSRPADGLLLAKRSAAGILVGVLAVAALQLVAWAVSLVGVQLESTDTSTSVVSMLEWSMSSSAPWLFVPALLAAVGVIGPVAEELVFRGVIGRTVVDSGFARGRDGSRSTMQTLAACLVSGLFFGLPHVTGFSVAGLQGAVVMTLFGALLTWMSSVRSRSLAPAIAAHVTLNTAQLLLALATL